MHCVTLDRRVQVLDPTDESRKAYARVSDLRAEPFWVLLGEPGIGKSTVFETEANAAETRVLKVRGLLTGSELPRGETLFLDALDEYRVDGSEGDKIYALANAIRRTNPASWRLSCRSEDWRKAADLGPLRDIVGGQPIVVAALLPLDPDEAEQILAGWGEIDPRAFVRQAHNLGADAFTGSPLSLRLLHTAISDGGGWPSTRYELFDRAARQLTHEQNEERRWQVDRPSPDLILDAAGRTFLTQLLTGARSLWRSNASPPSNGDRLAFIRLWDVECDPHVLAAAIDTPLFRGEGEAFESIHRTLAEFLGAKALAEAVVGSAGHAALPFSRALAFIAAPDGLAPTELRGIYAWFAAHLSKKGRQTEARALIERDPFSVLAYGDAAVFPTESRKHLLRNLAHDDPYFRASEVGATAISGLAAEDLAPEFAKILTSESEESHRLITVYEALMKGTPIISLRPLLRKIALDPERPVWQRWRAIECYINGSGDKSIDLRYIFDSLAKERSSPAQIELRTDLAARLYPQHVTVRDLKKVIAAYARDKRADHTIGGLYGITKRLQEYPCPELFREKLKTWLPDTPIRHSGEIDRLLDNTLAAVIRSDPGLRAGELWCWLTNVTDEPFPQPQEKTAEAIRNWLSFGPRRDLELFCAILGEDLNTDSIWRSQNRFMSATGIKPSLAICRYVFDLANSNSNRKMAAQLYEASISIAFVADASLSLLWEIHGHLLGQKGSKQLINLLTKCSLRGHRIEARRHKLKRQRQLAKTRVRNIEVLTTQVPELREGRHFQNLDWAARTYFAGRHEHPQQEGGVAALRKATNEDITLAILDGWKHLITHDLGGIDVTKLGEAEGKNWRFHTEFPAIAGLECMLESEVSPPNGTIPIQLAIIVFRAGSIAGQGEQLNKLEGWAIDRLATDPQIGAKCLYQFWSTAVDHGAIYLDTINRLGRHVRLNNVLRAALKCLLINRPNMPPQVLNADLRTSAKLFDHTELLAIAESNLGQEKLSSAAKYTWLVTAFALQSSKYERDLAECRGSDEDHALLERSYGSGFIDAFPVPSVEDRILRSAALVRVLGNIHAPYHERPSGRVSTKIRMSDTVYSTIAEISQAPSPLATKLLRALETDGSLAKWNAELRHALARQQSLRRDHEFAHPRPDQVRRALSGGPPVSAADLKAVLLDELERFKRELRTQDTTPWKRFWNLDRYGRPTIPLIENECRDVLLDHLRPDLARYQIAATVPEARRANETRADVIIISGVGKNLPIEVKRHDNRELWTALESQLAGYASSEGAAGFGVYLVLWFGSRLGVTPSRPGSGPRPANYFDLESMLKQDVSEHLRSTIDVVVLDVSPPVKRPKPSSGRKGSEATTTRC